MAESENIRNTKPLSLVPMTPEEALRRAMQVPAPISEPPAPKRGATAKRGKKAAKKK